MDDVEEAGLRAFAVSVGADPDGPGPVWVAPAEARVGVTQIEATWGEVERIGYRVHLTDGTCWLLYYVPELGLWSGIAMADPDNSRAVA